MTAGIDPTLLRGSRFRRIFLGVYVQRSTPVDALVREDVDSPMETRLRLLIVLAGLPEPEVNHTIRDECGQVLLRLDLSYPHLRLIVEYDGRQHAEDPRQRNRDLDRREYFDDEEWRVRRALVKRGCPGVPRRLDESWRSHFPSR